MPAGYVIAQLKVTNPENYKEYVEKVTPLVKKFGGEFLVRAGEFQIFDGETNFPRIIILIEFCEESGSPDLPYYMEDCKEIIGDVDLVICLDSGAGNYEQFWTTVSLRGMIACKLQVNVLKEGVHSGSASGVVPSPFRLLSKLINRLEDSDTGKIDLENLNVEIPDERKVQALEMVECLGNWEEEFPWYGNTKPSTSDSYESMLTGLGGLP